MVLNTGKPTFGLIGLYLEYTANMVAQERAFLDIYLRHYDALRLNRAFNTATENLEA